MSERHGNKQEFKHPIAVLVEGLDTLHFIRNRIKKDVRFQNISLHDFIQASPSELSASGQNAPLNRFIRAFMNVDHAAVKAFAIIRDAEADSTAMWQSVTDAFKQNNITLPAAQNSIAMCGMSGLLVGGLLLPFGKTSGCLEHAMLDAKTANDSKDVCIQSFYSCLTNSQNNSDSLSNYEAKLKVHATILGHSQRTDEVSRTLGQTANAGFWDWTQPSLKIILDFLESLEKQVKKQVNSSGEMQ